jgi:hypothetical protein
LSQCRQNPKLEDSLVSLLGFVYYTYKRQTIPVEDFSLAHKALQKTFTKKTLTMTASTRRKTLENQKNVDRDAETREGETREGASNDRGKSREKKVQRRKSRRVAGKPPEFAGLQ